MKTCPLCSRDIPEEWESDHHLWPQSVKPKKKQKKLKTKEKVTLHKCCHDVLHRTLTNRELATSYNTIDKLLAHPEIKSFAEWIATKDINYYPKHRQSSSRSKKGKYN